MWEMRQWSFKQLAEAGQLSYGDGYRTKKSEHGDVGLPILRVAEVLDGRIEPSFSEFVREAFRAKMGSKVSRTGDVVLTTKGTVGRVAIIPESMREFVYSPQVCYFRSTSESTLTARYLYYWLRSEQFRRQAAAMKGQTDMADYLNLADIGALKITTPPLGDQRAIAEVLGALDDKLAVNQRIVNTALRLADCRHQVAQQLSVGSQSTLLELSASGCIEFGDGYRTKKAEHGKPGVPILRVAEVGDGDIHPSLSDHVRDEYRQSMKGKVSRPGDVVLTTKGTVGRAALISPQHPEFVYSPQVCYFRVSSQSPVSSLYLFHWLRGPEFWSQAASVKGQTDMADYLSLRDIGSLRITLPAKAALGRFDRECGVLAERSEAAQTENRTLAELRDILLPKLISGQIRIKDAERAVEEAV